MGVNKLISTNLAAITTFENERRKERQCQGIQAAKKNGKYLGRKTVITKKLIAQVQDLIENKKLSHVRTWLPKHNDRSQSVSSTLSPTLNSSVSTQLTTMR